MVPWLSNLLSGGIGEIISKVGETIDRFVLTDGEKSSLKMQLEQLLQKRDSELEETLRIELAAKERVLVAELTQGDSYTKRARPSIVYVGLVVMTVNYCLAPLIALAFGKALPELRLPEEFWYAWTGVSATWVIGRTFEKRGEGGRVVERITGAPTSRLLS